MTIEAGNDQLCEGQTDHQKGIILDYSRFLEDDHRTGIGGIHSAPKTKKLFFRKRGWCPFCRVNTHSVYHIQESYSYPPEQLTDDPDYHPPGGGYIEQGKSTEVWSCRTCGWWETTHDYHDDWMWIHAIRHAILRTFEPNDIRLPVSSLRKHLFKNANTIYQIAPRKMEELVQSVFRDFFQCEVVHCGRSHDGGIDLILILSDEPTAIQVKRRAKQASVEPVSTVRNLLGATLLKTMKRALVVTTADHFSREARTAATAAVTLDLVESFDLVDSRRFLEMLQLIHTAEEENWRPYIWGTLANSAPTQVIQRAVFPQ